MKTKVIILTSILFFLSISIFAQDTIEETNISQLENGITVKECVSVNKKTNKKFKTAYHYNSEGQKIVRYFYIWDKGTWKNSMMHEYSYNAAGKNASVLLTRWDNKKETWSNKKQLVMPVYENSGELLSIIQSEVKNENVFTQHVK